MVTVTSTVKVSGTSEITLSFDTRAEALLAQTGSSKFIQIGELRYTYDPSGTALTTGDGRTWKPSRTATPEHFGAAGNGVEDDTSAWQKAIDSGLPIVGRKGAIYKITSTLTVPSNTRIDMNGSRFRRGWEAGVPIMQNVTAETTWSEENIALFNMWAEDDTDCRGPFCRMVGVKDLRIDGFRWVVNEAYTAGDTGAFGLEVSGEDIVLSNFNIDSYTGGRFCDGVHPLWVKNFTFTNFVIHSGDDALGLSFRSKMWGNRGKEQASENVYIANGVVSSEMANAIRIGGEPDTHPDQRWINVTIENIVIGGDRDAKGGRYITLEDERAAADITAKNDDIVLRNIRAHDPGTAGFIAIIGNPDPANSANFGQHNFNKVILQDVESTHDEASTWFYGGGVDELMIDAGRFAQNVAQTSIFGQFFDIGRLELRNLKLKPQTSSIAADFRWCNTIELYNPEIEGSGSELTIIRLNQLDALVAPRFRVYGGYIRNASYLINRVGGNPVTEVSIYGTDLAGAATAAVEPNVETISTTYTVIPAAETAHSSGATGGTGSAGAGNQYVEMTIGGATYKVLHDGTV